MGKQVSCGILIFNNDKELFLCRATGLGKWDLPKGAANSGESYVVAAQRELKEETGFDVSINELVDMGKHKYHAMKDLQLFMYVGNTELEAANAVCSSYFINHDGQRTAEMDAFKFMSKDEAKKNVAPHMWTVLSKFFE